MRERAILDELKRDWDALGKELGAGAPAARPAGPPFPTTAAGLFAELEEVLHLQRELRRARPARFARRFVNAGWTLRDLLAHLASWAAEFRRQVETIAADREFDYAIPFAFSVIGPNQWNEEQVQERRSLGMRAVLDQLEDETRRLQDVVLGLPRERLLKPAMMPAAPNGDPQSRMRGNIAIVVSGKCAHDRYHLGQIRRWLAERESEARPAGRRTRRPK